MLNTLTYTNTWAQFDGPNIGEARSVLRYRQKGYVFTQAYKRGFWDGFVYMVDRNGRLPAGLVSELVTRLEQEGIDVETKDNRPARPIPETNPSLWISPIELRPYQEEAVMSGLVEGRGVIHHPTGAGKTVVMGELVRRIGCRALILVHRKDLLHQTVRRFREQLGGMVVGTIGDGIWEPNLITVATFQTLSRNPDKAAPLLREIEQVHVDEVHHLPAKTLSQVMAQLVNAWWRFGYSATPFKHGDLETRFKVTAWIGPVIHRVTAEKLVSIGGAVPTDVFLIKMSDEPKYLTYPDALRKGIVENTRRNAYIKELADHLNRTKSGPIIILVERIKHGKLLSAAIGCPFVAGEDSTKYRERMWRGLRDETINVLVTSKIADEGLDIPPLAYLIIAGGGKAPHVTIQRVGRGMRPSPGKSHLFVFDFMDKGKYLKSHAKSRRKTYEEQPAYTVNEVEIEEVL